MTRYSIALILTLLSASAIAGEISEPERKVVTYIDAHVDDAVTLLQRVVDIPSATENHAGVRAVGKVFEAAFQEIGFETRWDEMPAALNRAGHLIAEHPGTKGKRILLIGHLDTVLQGRSFHRDPANANHATGNGVVDMKGGDVVILYALKALHAAGALEGRQVSVIFTGDEEDAGLPIETSRGSMRALARKSDAALAFEAGHGGTATVARRGVGSWSMTVKARTGHSSGIFGPGAGAGAIFEASRVLDEFRRALTGQPGLTFNASLFLGGTTYSRAPHTPAGSAEGKSNVIPGEAFVHGDLRFLSDAQCDAAEATMRAIVAMPLPRTTTTIEFDREYPAMSPTPGNYALLAVLDRVSLDLGLGEIKAFDPSQRGAGDISFVAPFVSGLDGLGPLGDRSHTPDESLKLDSLAPQTKRAALLIDRLIHDETNVTKSK